MNILLLPYHYLASVFGIPSFIIIIIIIIISAVDSFFREYIPKEYLIIISEKGGNKKTIGLFKNVVWAFLDRNGKIHWVAARIPVVTVKFRRWRTASPPPRCSKGWSSSTLGTGCLATTHKHKTASRLLSRP